MNTKPANTITGTNIGGNLQLTPSKTTIEALPVNQMQQNQNNTGSSTNSNTTPNPNTSNVQSITPPTQLSSQASTQATTNVTQIQQKVSTQVNQTQSTKSKIKPILINDLKPQAFIPLIATISSMTSILQSILAIFFKYKQINNNLIEHQVTTQGMITLISHSIYILIVTIITIIFSAKLDLKEKNQYRTITIIISSVTIFATIFFNQIVVNSFINNVAHEIFPHISNYIESLLI